MTSFSVPVAGCEHQHFVGDRTRERPDRRSAPVRPSRAPSTIRLRVCAKTRRFVRSERRVGVLGQQDCRVQGQRAAKAQSQAAKRRQHTALTPQIREAKPISSASCRHAARRSRGQIIDRQRIRNRQVLLDRELLDEDGALGEQAELVERLQPGVAVGDRRRRAGRTR